MEQTTISIEQAQVISEKVEKENEQFEKEYKEDVEMAHDELWDAMGSEDFRMDDFDMICGDYGVEPDDLFHRLI